MNNFTINNAIVSKRKYLTEEDRVNIPMLAVSMSAAETEEEMLTVARLMLNAVKRNREIDKHERLIGAAISAIADLNDGDIFTHNGLAWAMMNDPALTEFCNFDCNNNLCMPYGAVTYAINRMVERGFIVPIRYRMEKWSGTSSAWKRIG